MNEETASTSNLQLEGFESSNTDASSVHEPTSTAPAKVLSTVVPGRHTVPQMASVSPSISSLTPMSSSVGTLAPSSNPASAGTSSYGMNGDARPMLAAGTPSMSPSDRPFGEVAGGISVSAVTNSPGQAPMPKWGSSPTVYSLSGTAADSLKLAATSRLHYGSSPLSGMPEQPMFDYSHLPPQQLQTQHQGDQGQSPWESNLVTGPQQGSHAQHASSSLTGRPGGGLVGPSATAPGGGLRPFGSSNNFFTPRGLNPNSGLLGVAPGGGMPCAPGSGPSVMTSAATPSSLLHPMAPPMGQVDPYCYPVLQQPMPPPIRMPKKGKNLKKADGKQPTFLTKLYDVLERPEYHHIIRWDEAGEMIIIERPDELAEKILPLVYRQSRFASFSRQLNIYGWMRKVSLRHVESGIHDPDASTWSHPFLRRNSTKEDILGFKRRVPPRPSQAQKNAQRIAAEINSSDSDSFIGPPSVIDPYAGLLGGLDENRPVFQFAHGPENLKLPRYIPTRPPYQTITRTNFGPEPTPATQGPPLPDPHSLSYAIERKDSGNPRRYSMPTSLSRTDIPEARPILKDLKDVSMTNAFAPSSAPATAGTFSMHSVPSFGPASRAGSDASIGSVASFASTTFSPGTSMANLDLADGYAVEDDELLRGTTEQPQYRIDDVSSWARRGMGLLGQGMRPSPPMPYYGFVDPKMTNHAGNVNYGSGAMSGMISADAQMAGGMQGTMSPPMGGMMAQGVNVPMSINVGGINEERGQPVTPPSTVSPGVYQKGFNLPWRSPKEGVMSGGVGPAGVGRSSPAMSTKKERRQSLTSPYATNSPPRVHAGVVRGVGGNNKRDSLPNIPHGSVPNFGQAGGAPSIGEQQQVPSSGQQTGPAASTGPGTHSAHIGPSSHDRVTTDDEGLPSASASLDRPPLFQGQLDIDPAPAHSHTRETSATD